MSSFPALVLLALVVATSAQAADPGTASHACASVVEPAERLACYDAAFPPTAAEAAPMLTPEQEREQAVARFGLNRQQVEKREPERRREDGPARIEDVVAGVSYPKSGGRVSPPAERNRIVLRAGEAHAGARRGAVRDQCSGMA